MVNIASIIMGNKTPQPQDHIDWEGLPHNLLNEILTKVESMSDYMQFGAVCVSWRSVWEFNNVERNDVPRQHQPPMLLVPSRANKSIYAWQIYDPASNEFLGRWVYVPGGDKWSSLKGYSHGWLLKLCRNRSATLYRPFSMTFKSVDHIKVEKIKKKERKGDARTIDLPDLALYKSPNISLFGMRTLITGDPAANPNKCIVVVTRDWGLAILRLGRDSSWTFLNGPEFEGLVDTVVLNGNRVYAIRSEGSMISFEISDSMITTDPAVDEVAPSIDLCPSFVGRKFFCYRYLVRLPCSADDLLQVERYARSGRTIWFRVFRFSSKDKGWVRVTRLEDTCLFVGDCSSVSIKCSRFSGYKSNCVYFTPDTSNGFPELDMGIYDLGKNKVEQKYPLVLDSLDFKKDGPSFWLVPTI